MTDEGPLGDGRVLTVVAIAGLWGIKNALALRQVVGSQDAQTLLQDRAARAALDDLSFRPDGRVVRR